MKKRIISLLTIAAILGTSIPLSSEDVKAFADSIKGAGEPITILEEVEELRGEYEKHFLNSDGTITAVSYEKPVHTFEEGEWQEIDNTLQSEENVLVNKEGILDVAFADTTDDSGESESTDSDLVTIEKDNYKISWSITAEDEGMEEPEAERYLTSSMFRLKKEKESGKTEKKKVTYTMKGKKKANIKEDKLTGLSAEEKKTVAGKVKSQVAYENLFCDNIDIEYTLISDSVKEDIVLNEKTNIETFVMEMNLKGLTPKIQEDNSIVFLNSEEEPEFIMPAPFMTDEAEGYSEDIELQIERIEEITATGETSEKYLLKLTPDKEWLNAEERVYPVTIDPTVSPSNAKTNVRDTYIYTGDSTKHNSETTMYVGLRKGNVNRSFIKFTTMPTITGAITKAKMTFTVTSGTTTYGTMKIYKMDEYWDSSTITWANQPTAFTYTNIGVRSGYNISFTVTTAVKEWYSNSNYYGTNKNYGFSVRYSDETYNDYNRFYTAEATANRPVLEITYEPSDNPNLAKTLNVNTLTDGNINYGGHVSWYAFTPDQSGTYEISSEGSTNTLGKIYQGKTTLLANNDNGGLNNNFKIEKNLTAGITYYIRVSGNSSNVTGAFKLIVKNMDPFHHSNIQYMRYVRITGVNWWGVGSKTDHTINVIKSSLYADDYCIIYDNINQGYNREIYIDDELKTTLNNLESGYQKHYNIIPLLDTTTDQENAAHSAKGETDQLVEAGYFSKNSSEYYGVWAYNYVSTMNLGDYWSGLISKTTVAYSVYLTASSFYYSYLMATNKTAMQVTSSQYTSMSSVIDDIDDAMIGVKYKNRTVMSSDLRNAELAKDGLVDPLPYKPQTPVVQFEQTASTKYVRVYGKNNKFSKWMMKYSDIEGLTPAQIKSKFALQDEPTYYCFIDVPAGTSVYVGVVNESSVSGTLQYELATRIDELSFGIDIPLQ